MSKKFIVFLLMILNMTSCSPIRTATEPDPVPMKLINSTVAFVYEDKDDSKWVSFCAGVWVAPEIMLTAYHCTRVAKEAILTEQEKVLSKLTGTVPDSTGSPIQYSDSSAFDVISGGAISHYDAVVIFTDKDHDIALVKVSGEFPSHLIASIATDEPKLGDEVRVIGHPAGLSFTYTHGYVSGFHSGIITDSLNFNGPFLQINATIVGGNSGGGVFSKDGKLLGIVSFTNRRAMGQGFAIPSGSIKKMLEKYNEKKKKEQSL